MFGYFITGFVMGILMLWWFFGRRPMMVVLGFLLALPPNSRADSPDPDATVQPSVAANSPIAVIYVKVVCNNLGTIGFSGSPGNMTATNCWWAGGPPVTGTEAPPMCPLYDYGTYYFGSGLVGSGWAIKGATGNSVYVPLYTANWWVMWTKGASYATVQSPNGQWDIYEQSEGEFPTSPLNLTSTFGAGITTCWGIRFVKSSPGATDVSYCFCPTHDGNQGNFLGPWGGLYLLNVYNAPTTNTTTRSSTSPTTSSTATSSLPTPTTKPWGEGVADALAGGAETDDHIPSRDIVARVDSSVKDLADYDGSSAWNVSSQSFFIGSGLNTIDADDDSTAKLDFQTLISGLGAGNSDVIETSLPAGDTVGTFWSHIGGSGGTSFIKFYSNVFDSWTTARTKWVLWVNLIRTIGTGFIAWRCLLGVSRMIVFAVSPQSAGVMDSLQLEG